MWERTLSQKLVRLFCEQKVVDESKADAYVYGYELLISSVVSILLVILISIICGDVRYSLSFLIGFIPQRIETVKAEMNGLTPGLDRSPPPRWMGGQGGQSLKVFGRTRSFWGLSSPKIEMGGKALKWLSRLDYPLAKTGETVNGGAESAVHLDR